MTTDVGECVRVVLKILGDVGVPTPGSNLRQRRQAKALMALMDVKSVEDLPSAKSIVHRGLVTREIIDFENLYLGEAIGMGSYDDIRRRDLRPSALANVAVQEEGLAKNDGTRKWGVSPPAVEVFRAWGTSAYEEVVSRYVGSRGRLDDELLRARELAMVPVRIPGGEVVKLSGGAHDELIRATIEEFLPRYGYGAEIVYFADAMDRGLYVNESLMESLSMPSLDDGDLLPDIIAFSQGKGWVYLIEAVHSTGPVSAEKRLLLSRRFSSCTAPIVYVTTFASRASFRAFASQIGWETEVWIADEPDHVIHFNGDRFLGPYE